MNTLYKIGQRVFNTSYDKTTIIPGMIKDIDSTKLDSTKYHIESFSNGQTYIRLEDDIYRTVNAVMRALKH